MASNSVLKSARDSGFDESDPLAELSRIMGLAREDAAANGSDADFHIDLEQELMGAFAEEEPRSQANDVAPPVQHAEAPPAESEFDDMFSEVFEQEAFEATLQPSVEEFEEPIAVEPETPFSDEAVTDEQLTAAFSEEDFAEAFDAEDFAEAEAAPVFDTAATYSDGMDDLDVAFSDVEGLGEPLYEAAPDESSEFVADEPVVVAPEPLVEAIPQMEFKPAMSLEDELAALLGVSAPVVPNEQPAVEAADDAAAEMEFAPFEDDALAAELVAVDDESAETEVMQAASDEEWTAEQAAQELFEAGYAADLLPNPDVAEPVEDTLALAQSQFDEFEEIAFDDADLDFTLSDDEMAAEPAEIDMPSFDAVDPVDTTEFDTADDLEAAIAQFSDERTWSPAPAAQPAAVAVAAYPAAVAAPTSAVIAAPVAETRPAPVSTFNWQSLRSEPAAVARTPEPVAAVAEPDIDDSDPFAALAALAAAPPILRTLGRTNPVAVNPPVVDRSAPRTVAPAEAPRTVAAVEPRRTFAPVESVQMPAAAAQPSFAPYARQPEPKPLPPVVPLGLRPAFPAAPAAATLAATAFAARPVVQPVAAKPATPAPAKDVFADDEFPDLDELLNGGIFAPDVDTVEIQDPAVALADEIDIPDFGQREPASQQVQYDDLDEDFTSAFNQLSNTLDQRSNARNDRTAAAAPPPPAPTYYVDRSASTGTTAPTQPAYAPSGYAADDYDAQLAGFDASTAADDRFMDDDAFAVDPYDNELAEDDSRPARNRGVLIAAIVAGVAIVGGIGAFALSFGSGGDDVPALVKADTSPVKVKPETPGGVVVPNQDGKVYEQVSGAPAAAPAQEKLITAAEEPIAPAAPVAAAPAAEPAPEAALPGVVAPQIKSEERVTPADTAQTPPESQDVAAITPRKVRTMIVRPDGTLVAREDLPAAAAPAQDAVTTGMTPVPTTADAQTMAAAQPATVVPSAVPGAQDDVSILPAEDAAPASEAATPSAAEVIVPAPRPARTSASEPTRVVTAEPARAAVPEPARAAPAPEPAVEVANAPAAAAASSVWSVQIASQPTREGAQASYEDLARRYGGVLGGKGVNIVQAEVTGKGTMWRVRVPSASKNDANILCAKLKTAGGSCFVSQ